jgi:hypothetical protein
MQLRNCEGGGLDMRRAGTVCWCSSRTTFGRYGRFLLTALLEMIGTLVRTDHVATHHRPKRALASTPTPTPEGLPSIKYPSKPERLRQRACRHRSHRATPAERLVPASTSVQLRVAWVAAAVV